MMRRPFLLAAALLCALTGFASGFGGDFRDETLRLDYVFGGTAGAQRISLASRSRLEGWAGRRMRLDSLPLRGNGQTVVRDAATGRVIYRTSFSHLFTEWLSTPEAALCDRSFEQTLLLPYPLREAEIETVLYDMHGRVAARHTQRFDPSDVLVRRIAPGGVRWEYLHRGGDPERCIDVAIVAEGYTEAEMERFREDALRACRALFAHEPFGELRGRFNVVAVYAPSSVSGVSVPREGRWCETPAASHFDTFYSERYLTTSSLWRLHDLLAGIPYEHLVLLANTGTYGGGGIYNSYTLTAAHHPLFEPVVVHEFGHSFGGLGDEYFYDNGDIGEGMYDLSVEPWEPNITTLCDFDAKWADLLPAGTPRPTPADSVSARRWPVGLYEGGGYSSKGVFRPADDCRMRTNTCEAFCPVCRRALRRLIEFYTDDPAK